MFLTICNLLPFNSLNYIEYHHTLIDYKSSLLDKCFNTFNTLKTNEKDSSLNIKTCDHYALNFTNNTISNNTYFTCQDLCTTLININSHTCEQLTLIHLNCRSLLHK